MICPADGSEKPCLTCNDARLRRCTLDLEKQERLQHKEYRGDNRSERRDEEQCLKEP